MNLKLLVNYVVGLGCGVIGFIIWFDIGLVRVVLDLFDWLSIMIGGVIVIGVGCGCGKGFGEEDEEEEGDEKGYDEN